MSAQSRPESVKCADARAVGEAVGEARRGGWIGRRTIRDGVDIVGADGR